MNDSETQIARRQIAEMLWDLVDDKRRQVGGSAEKFGTIEHVLRAGLDLVVQAREHAANAQAFMAAGDQPEAMRSLQAASNIISTAGLTALVGCLEHLEDVAGAVELVKGLRQTKPYRGDARSAGLAARRMG